ncbi:substrate-binding domain-containing protein [Franzmannia qiaohouensis]|uniref:Substrate-binding domain-containing protein n=1 Tax=Franzmannia qiaohouensis TaxID=1329370 RepID=A0ABU1HFH9_9GAMM|nr:substrate-binding domain-containing protein [Halomonas qiaohouensis]MDR5906227.1 substrate-binding domain-containing protein [Halomonas qiaohouensis]
MPRRQRLTILALGIALSAPLAVAEERFITLASTTSTEQSGLFADIVPQFREATGIDVRVVAVGTGQAFEIARRGDADSLLVHDTEGEERFIAAGYASERLDVMYNDFVLIGPRDDPAGIAEADDILDAFNLIAASGTPFTSRGDDSGTHRAEQRFWQDAGVDTAGSWYRELGSGMGATLNTAAAMDAYVFADRATWLAFDNRHDLAVLFEGDEALFNPYGSLLLDRERHPHLKHDLAEQWHRWLVSKEGQEAIAGYTIDGEQLFFPNAE